MTTEHETIEQIALRVDSEMMGPSIQSEGVVPAHLEAFARAFLTEVDRQRMEWAVPVDQDWWVGEELVSLYTAESLLGALK